MPGSGSPRNRKTGEAPATASPMRLWPILFAVTLAGLAACSTTVSLTYTPTRAVVPGPPSFLAAVTATDARGQEPYVLLSRPSMNGITPVATTHRLVADEVAAVFTEALQARGMVAAAAPYQVRLTLHGLGGNTYFGAHILDGPVTDNDSAYIDIELAVTDRRGRTIYLDTVQDARDLNTSPAVRNDGTLVALVQALLSATVDRMLDNPAFRTATQRH